MIPPPPISTLFPYTTLFRSQFRRIGADAQLDEVEFSVFNQRTQAGRFDAAVIARTTDPTPSSSIGQVWTSDRKSTRLNSSHRCISYAVFCLKKKTDTISDNT